MAVQLKSERRYKHLKDAQNTVATFTSAMIVAVVAFVAQIDQTEFKPALIIGLGFLFLSLLSQLTSQLILYIGSGFNDDWVQSEFTDEESGKDTQTFGKLFAGSFLISYASTFIGFVLVCVFLCLNI